MACINCNAGPFINDATTNWLRSNISFTTPNGVTLTQTTGGMTPGIVVSKGTKNQIFSEPAGSHVSYLNWGNPKNFIAILTATNATRVLTVINTHDPNLATNNVVNVGATPAQQGPFINYCAGDGTVILTIFQTSLALWPADGNATAPMASGMASNPAQSFATVTATAIEIHSGATVVDSCPKPVGNSKVMPGSTPAATIDFGVVVIGPGVPPALTTSTKQAIIKNLGPGCLPITGITNAAPYSVVPASFTPTTLQPNAQLTFDVLFNPGTIAGSPFNRDLVINPAPGVGDKLIHCTGKARLPQLKITPIAPVFNRTRVGDASVPVNLRIKNTGEGDVSLLSFPAATTPEFNWVVPALPTVIAYNTWLDIPITFRPSVDGTNSRSIFFDSGAGNSPHNITLTGQGCVPNAKINLASNPVDLGSVQKGFRTVRSFKITNSGDDILRVDAAIEPSIPGDPNSTADASLFGLLEDQNTPVISPLAGFSNKTINPVVPCGSIPTGSGDYLFGIAFFAGDSAIIPVPRTVSARLRIFNHNDTSAPVSFLINLTAQITNPVSLDAALVIDRSGSMADPSGSRKKIDTAIDAAKLFVRLFRPDVDDRLSIVRFNNTPEIVPGLGIQVITSANQANVENQVNSANFSPAGSTCIAGGVMVAEADIRNNPRAVIPPELNKVILVLTDGIDNSPYLNPADGQYYSLLGGISGGFPFGGFPFIPFGTPTIALPVPTDLKIYAVGIGDSIDTGKLGQLAASTGGVFLHTTEFSGQDYFDLEKHFTQVYMEAVNYAQIEDPVYEILSGEEHTFNFEVLNGDKSAIVVIYDRDSIRIPFWIYTPVGEIIDLLSVPPGFQIRPGISPTARFIEINMPQNEPGRYAGSWKIVIRHDKQACYYGEHVEQARSFANMQEVFSGGFQPLKCEPGYKKPIMYGIAIGVGSNFSLAAFVTPGIVKTGESILLSAMVSEFGLPVKGCTVQVKASKPDGSQSQFILYDDGNHLDDEKDDGSYAISYSQTSQEGSYTFIFSATGYSRDGKLLKREIARSKYVQGRVPLVIDNPSSPGGEGKDKCCSSLKIWIIVGVILLFIIALLLLFIWRR